MDLASEQQKKTFIILKEQGKEKVWIEGGLSRGTRGPKVKAKLGVYIRQNHQV